MQLKKLIKMYNEKYGDTLGVIDDDFNKEQMYRIYYFIKNNCDDKDIQDRIKMINLDKPKTLEQQLTKLESENGNSNDSNIKKYVDDGITYNNKQFNNKDNLRNYIYNQVGNTINEADAEILFNRLGL